MRKLWYYFVKAYIRTGFIFYFKKVIRTHIDNIPLDKAVLYVANHQNALIDPLLIGAFTPKEMYYLTRAQVFNNKWISKILYSVNMLPIYRIRDGYESLSKNEAVFNICYKILGKRGKVLIFPEGNHNIQRRVRILSKGFTRIVFGALEKNPDLEVVIVPIGLNYSKFSAYASMVNINYGEPIAVNPFWNDLPEPEAANALKEKVSQAMKNLTTHIESSTEHDEIIKHFRPKEFLHPEKVNKRLLSGDSLPKVFIPQKRGFNLLEFLVRLNSFFPLLIWKQIEKKIDEREFIATFKFTVAITAVPIFYLIQSCIIGSWFTPAAGYTYFFISVLAAFILTKTKK